MRRIAGKGARGACVMRGNDEAGLEITGNGMTGDKIANEPLGVLCQCPQVAGMKGPQPALQFGLVFAQSRMNLAAIAARGGKSNRLGLDQRHDSALFGQVKRGGKTGEAGADDTDISADRVIDGRLGRTRLGACRVIALGEGRG